MTDPRLQTLLNSAMSRGDYADVALVLAQMTADNVAQYRARCLCPETSANAGKPHVFETKHAGGWPIACSCVHCGHSAPESFCRHPLTCCFAGRCCSEIVCND